VTKKDGVCVCVTNLCVKDGVCESGCEKESVTKLCAKDGV